jgi:hypothetical protein
MAVEWVYDDGGSGSHDLKDCVPRAIAIASGRPYDEVHEQCEECNAGALDDAYLTPEERAAHEAMAEDGLDYHGTAGADEGLDSYLEELGFQYHRCGLGDDPLPTTGRLIVVMPGHFAAVIEGVLHDTWDCRGRPVEGYWMPAEEIW